MRDGEPTSRGEPTAGVLSAIAGIGLKRPLVTVLVAVLTMVVCAYVASDMPVTTSRYSLVSEDNPQQRRLFRFFERFGYPDSLVMVVTGGAKADRQRVVDQLTTRFEQDPELHERVLGKVGVDHIAEMLLVFQPQAVAQLQAELGEGVPLASVIEGGLPAWIDAIRGRLVAGLEGEGDAIPPAKVDEGFERLSSLMRALDAELAGQDPLAHLPSEDASRIPRGFGVDDEGYIVGGGGEYHLVALFPRLRGAEGDDVRPIVERVRRMRDTVDTGSVETLLTGLPALVADELDIVKEGIRFTSVLTTLAILLLLLVAFRSFRFTVLTLLPLGVGLVMTLAFVRLTYGSLNLITASLAPVLLGMGIDFGVYVLSRYGEQVGAGARGRDAIQGALGKAGPGLLIGASTTMIAFLMVTTTEFTAYSELGVITAVGLLLMVSVTFLLLPALIMLVGREHRIRRPELPGLSHIPALVRRARQVVPIAAAAALALSATAWGKVSYNNRYFDFLPEGTESARGLAQIETDRSVSPILAGIGADGVEQARELARRLRELPSVGAVQTATDVMPALSPDDLASLRKHVVDGKTIDFDKLRARSRDPEVAQKKLEELADVLDEVAAGLREVGHDTKAALELKARTKALAARFSAMESGAPLEALETTIANLLDRAWGTAARIATRGHYLPEDLPPVFKARFVSKDGKGLAVYATPAGVIWDTPTAKKFAEDVEAVDQSVSGLAVNVYVHQQIIRDSFRDASILSAGLVIVVLLIGLRRLHDALFAFLPLAVGFGWTLGLMHALEMSFNVANVVTLPLILGIGIDGGAHMVHRWRHSADAHGGVARLDEIIRGTGSAVVLASLTTMAGFGALMLGDYGAMKALGSLLTLGVGCTLVATVILLPCLLVLLGKAE